MTEKLHHSGEHLQETIDTSAEAKRNLERLQENAEQAEKDPLQKHVESLQKAAEAKAISGKELNVGDQNNENAAQSFGVSKHLKADAYTKTLSHIRTRLSAPSRTFSKVIHQPTIESASDALSKTVARPSAFLGGSLTALIGSAVLLYLAKHNGFTYNYSLLLLLFVVGFVAGGLLEGLVRLLRRKAS